MPLNRTTTRALAASVALVAAGGTVAAAAVFHLPVLGFGPANAGATPQQVAAVSFHADATKTAPIRVVRTRFVDQIVHRQTGHRASAAPPVTASAVTTAATTHALTTPTAVEHPKSPVVEPPDAPEPPEAGGDDHDGDDEAEQHDGDHDGHEHGGDDAEDSVPGTTQAGQ